MKGSRVHAGSVGRRSAGHTRRVHTAVLGSVRTGMLRCDVGRLPFGSYRGSHHCLAGGPWSLSWHVAWSDPSSFLHCGSRGFDSSVVRRRRASPGPWGGFGHERARHRSRCVNPFGLRRPYSAVGRSRIGQQAVELPGGRRRWALVVCSRIHRCRNDSRSGRIARRRHRHRFGCGCTHATRVCFSRRFRACRTTRRNDGGGRSRPRTRGCRWAAACRCHRRRKHPEPGLLGAAIALVAAAVIAPAGFSSRRLFRA